MAEPIEDQFKTLHHLVKIAQLNLAKGPWDYLMGGTESETTLKRNRQSLDSVAFRPRVLRDVSQVDCSATLFGKKVRLPVMLAPIGFMEAFTEGGGATAAKAAAEFGIPQILSSACSPGLEEVAAAAPDNFRIYQLYVRGDAAFIDDHVNRAIDSGYTAFCITVDTAHYSRRERDLAKRYLKLWRVRMPAGMEFQAALSWDDIKRFKDKHDIPLILKGIATTEDALLACDLGVEVIYVSNHGGRQLDHGLGSAEVLPQIVAAVGDRAQVMMDGGIMRGSDVVKGIALGATAVGIGRLACLGLAAAGQEGLVRVLELLEEEVRICLGLMGLRSFEELDSSFVTEAKPVTEAHVFSAFPHLSFDEGY